jgi:hypothetical protein
MVAVVSGLSYNVGITGYTVAPASVTAVMLCRWIRLKGLTNAENQPAPLLQTDIGGALHQATGHAVRDTGQRAHAAREHDHAPGWITSTGDRGTDIRIRMQLYLAGCNGVRRVTEQISYQIDAAVHAEFFGQHAQRAFGRHKVYPLHAFVSHQHTQHLRREHTSARTRHRQRQPPIHLCSHYFIIRRSDLGVRLTILVCHPRKESSLVFSSANARAPFIAPLRSVGSDCISKRKRHNCSAHPWMIPLIGLFRLCLKRTKAGIHLAAGNLSLVRAVET